MSACPTRAAAREALEWAGRSNPGPWTDHVRHVAQAAERIAAACGMDADKAYVLGLLHDVGRFPGPTHIRHAVDGYRFCMARGWTDAARICLTHSFPLPDIRAYNGKIDISDDDVRLIEDALRGPMDDYDHLIQLCDALADSTGFCILEKRWIDVVLRHGWNDMNPAKWRAWLEIKRHFDALAGQSIYRLLPGIGENSLR